MSTFGGLLGAGDMKQAEWYALSVLLRGEAQGSNISRKAGHKVYKLYSCKDSKQPERVSESTVDTLLTHGYLQKRFGSLTLSDAGRAALQDFVTKQES